MRDVKCPYCGNLCDADFCDVGVGMVQCGPYHCQWCGASEVGPYDNVITPTNPTPRKHVSSKGTPRLLTAKEVETRWYEPNTPPGSSANVIHGKVVSHQIMKSVYQDEFAGNPLWEDKEYVDSWYQKIREKE